MKKIRGYARNGDQCSICKKFIVDPYKEGRLELCCLLVDDDYDYEEMVGDVISYICLKCVENHKDDL